jgi:hypothetical protein
MFIGWLAVLERPTFNGKEPYLFFPVKRRQNESNENLN